MPAAIQPTQAHSTTASQFVTDAPTALKANKPGFKRGAIEMAAREVLLQSRNAPSLGAAASGVVSGASQLVKKALLAEVHHDPEGGDKKDSKGKDSFEHASPFARSSALTAKELRSVIDSVKDLRGGEKRKFLKDVYAQLSGELGDSKNLAEQISGWAQPYGLPGNSAFGYRIINRGGEVGIATGETRLISINERIKAITGLEQVDYGPNADAQFVNLPPELQGEFRQLVAEAQLIKSIASDLKKITQYPGLSGFIAKIFGQSGLKWSPETQKKFVDAVVQDVQQVVNDAEWFKEIKKLICNSTCDDSILDGVIRSQPDIGLKNDFIQNIKGKSLDEVRSLQKQLYTEVSDQTESSLASMEKAKFVDAVIDSFEASILTKLITALKDKKFLEKNVNQELAREVVNDERTSNLIYETVAQYLMEHLPEYEQLTQQYGLKG